MEANYDSANVSSNSSNGKEESTENIFVNHAEIAWQEMRNKWVGDPSQRTSELPMEPVISFNATYEDLLVSNTPFHKPIPLAEMVDFLTDHWEGDDLFKVSNISGLKNPRELEEINKAFVSFSFDQHKDNIRLM